MEDCEGFCPTTSRIHTPADWSLDQKEALALKIATARNEPCHFTHKGEERIINPPPVLLSLNDEPCFPYENKGGWYRPD